VTFAVREGWTYALVDKKKRMEWTTIVEYKPPTIIRNPREAVLIGIQVEDGMRVERKVRADTSETRLKMLMWQEMDLPGDNYFLHIRNTRDEKEESFKISRQWTYIMRTRPRSSLKNAKNEKRTEKNEKGEERVYVRLKTSSNSFHGRVPAKKRWGE
jgi:hypothetical protein